MRQPLIMFCVFFLCCPFAFAQTQHKKVSVLFIGNSYTYVNNLPLLVDSIAVSLGDTLDYDVSTPGGYTLQLHSTNATTLAKINQQAWDYVVLQEQSQLPSWSPSSVDSTTIPYALFLDSVIKANNSCTKTVFYLTWGRKHGDASNCPFYPPVCTYAGMQDRLTDSYKRMADTCHGIVAPVGEAFRTCIAFDSTINLYQSDESHPSLEGSFLAASVFYNIFFHRSASGSNFDPGITQAPAYMFHLFARQTVRDSINFWNLGVNEPWAEFTWYEAPNCDGVFTGVSNSNFSHYWDFGDSTTSSAPSPVHHYLHSQYYPVMHIVYDSCSSDTFRQANNMVCLVSSGNEEPSEEFEIFPVPARDELRILYSGIGIKSAEVRNLTGETVRAGFSKIDARHYALNVSALVNGIYFLRLIDEQGRVSVMRKIAVMK